MGSVISIRALGDNFAYVYALDKQSAIAVDPSDGSAVMGVLKKRGLELSAILVTHHHFDHTAGVGDLEKRYGCEVIGGDVDRIGGISRVVGDGEVLRFGEAEIEVVGTPGHTRTSVCYYKRASEGGSGGIVWTGDTLFVGGCGRILECGPGTMWESLMRLAKLPEDTVVYGGHDYIEENFEFASGIEPGNETVKRRLGEVRAAQRSGKVIESTIRQEKETNIFLRADTVGVKAAVGMRGASGADVFAELRRRKDYF
jgi:hydroxyacylglutathione hydrolase